MANKNIQIQDVDGNNLYPVSLIKVTYAQLKSLRDKSNLMPGMQYRITDYQCTTTQEDTQSAGHQFDIIVTADSSSKLNEKARAVSHDGDTYFASCNLAAWELWYCLDNDTNRFAWADAANGKGVVYRMIDEWHNDCPYDFKNIQFKRYKITNANISDVVGTYLASSNYPSGINIIDNNDSKMFYTFSYLGEFPDGVKGYKGEVLEDASIIGNTLPGDGATYGVHNNTIAITYDDYNEYEEPAQSLNNIVFLTYITDFYYGCQDNSFSEGCHDYSFDNCCTNNSFGQQCISNVFMGDCEFNSFDHNCTNILFGGGCMYNSFGQQCVNITFYNYCTHNILEGNNYNIYLQNTDFYHIKQDISNYNTINAYKKTVNIKTDGTIIEYNEADLIPTVFLAFTSNTNTSVKVYFTKASYDAKKPDDTISLIAKEQKEKVYYRDSIYKFEFDNARTITYAEIKGTLLDCNSLFFNCAILNTLDLSKLDTSKVTNMQYMFRGCGNLYTLDLSHFDTSNVTNMDSMFGDCNHLNTLNLSNFNTSNVMNMNNMFFDCIGLTTLDVSNFNTSNVLYMQEIFGNCSDLTTLNLSNWDPSNVQNMGGMFYNCQKLITLDGISNWDTSSVIHMDRMFLGCSNLTTLNLNFITFRVTDMNSMFSGCSKLSTLDVSKLDTSKVTDMSYMFKNCSKLTTIGSVDTASGWQHKPDRYDHMFDSCPATPKPKWYTA